MIGFYQGLAVVHWLAMYRDFIERLDFNAPEFFFSCCDISPSLNFLKLAFIANGTLGYLTFMSDCSFLGPEDALSASKGLLDGHHNSAFSAWYAGI